MKIVSSKYKLMSSYKYTIKLIIKCKDTLFIKNKLFFRDFLTIECDYLTSIEGIKMLIDTTLTEHGILSEFNEINSMKIFENTKINNRNIKFSIIEISSNSITFLRSFKFKNEFTIIEKIKNIFISKDLKMLEKVIL